MTRRQRRLPKLLLSGLIACSILLFDVETFAPLLLGGGPAVPQAEARIGDPLTPLSVAGVARRTTRRVIRRSAIYVAALPRGCTAVLIEGVSIYSCGATYYQPYGSQFVVVYVD